MSKHLDGEIGGDGGFRHNTGSTATTNIMWSHIVHAIVHAIQYILSMRQ